MDKSDTTHIAEDYLEIDKLSIQDPPVAESKALTFSGNSEKSVAEFVQAVQKYAFEHDRSSDDPWIAGYAGTCFSEGAALWYSGLDDKTRNNWNKLRKALVARYGPAPKFTGPPQIEQSPVLGPVNSPYINPSPVRPRRGYVTPPPPPMREKAPNELRGRIEVFVPERNLWLGYLAYTYDAYGSGMSFNLGGSKDSASIVSFVPDADRKPVQLRVEDGSMDMQHPFMGLALEEQQAYQIPGPPVYPQPVGLYGAGGCPPSCSVCHPCITGTPMPPCGMASSMAHVTGPQQPPQPATAPSVWTLKPCNESKQEERYRRAAKTANLWEKASAAIWKYDADTEELGVTWMNDDGTEEELAAFVPKTNTTVTYPGTPVTLRPQFRRVKDNAGEALNPSGHMSAWQNVPVKLFFIPEE